MSGWRAKRFWKSATVAAEGDRFVVLLDGRSVKTPAKAPLVMPTRAMAQAVAAEWDAQTGVINPETMPVTRSANAAIDKVAVQFDEVADLITAYGETDLLCYRAEHPAALIARQVEAWDPVLDWAARDLGAPLRAAHGVVFVAQPPDSLARLAEHVRGFDCYALTALHDLVAISGSLVLALAVARGQLTPQQAWDASRIDETWQTEQWGSDDEAEAAEAFRRTGFDHAARFLFLSDPKAAGDVASAT